MMAAQQVAELTLDELRRMIAEEVERQLQVTQQKPTRSVQEVNESIRRHRITPKPGTPSPRDMLREDRDH
jgi:F0F1-type ATP synthase membrane subunit b/b'